MTITDTQPITTAQAYALVRRRADVYVRRSGSLHPVMCHPDSYLPIGDANTAARIHAGEMAPERLYIRVDDAAGHRVEEVDSGFVARRCSGWAWETGSLSTAPAMTDSEIAWMSCRPLLDPLHAMIVVAHIIDASGEVVRKEYCCESSRGGVVERTAWSSVVQAGVVEQ